MLPGIRGMIRTGGGAPVLKAASSYNGSSATTHNVTMPSSFAAGDLLICMFNVSTTFSSFTGWNNLAGITAKRCFYKIAAGGDSASIVLSSSGALEASIAAYGGSVGGLDGTPVGAGSTNSDPTLGAITVGTAGGTEIAGAITTSPSTVSTPSGFSLDTAAITPSTMTFYWFSKAVTVTGSTGTVLIDQSGTTSCAAAHLYLLP